MKTHESFIATDPFIYRGAAEAELGYGERAVTSRLFEHISPKGQRIGVYAAQPASRKDVSEPEATIIMPASHEYRLEPLWIRRMQQMATFHDARVVGVEMPGTVGLLLPDEFGKEGVYDIEDRLEGATQTSHQILNAIRGDFREHADVQLDAIDATIGLDEKSKYMIFGESMGAAVATDMLGRMKHRGLDVEEVILYEQVNSFHGTRPFWPIQMMSLLPGIENARRNVYIAENSDIEHPITAFELSGTTQAERVYHKKLDDARKSLGQQGVAGMVNGLGMARGRVRALERSLSQYGSADKPLITLVRGRESTVTKEADFVSFAQHFKSDGQNVRTFTIIDSSNENDPVPIGHSHLFSTGRQADVAKRLRR